MISDPSKEYSTVDGPTTVSVSQEEALEAFAGWEPQIQALLKVRVFGICDPPNTFLISVTVHQEAHEICPASYPSFRQLFDGTRCPAWRRCEFHYSKHKSISMLTKKPLGTRDATTSRGRSWFSHRGKNPKPSAIPFQFMTFRRIPISSLTSWRALSVHDQPFPTSQRCTTQSAVPLQIESQSYPDSPVDTARSTLPSFKT